MPTRKPSPARHLGSWTPDAPEWHEARRHGLGGSEIAAVLGLSPWESRFSLWHRKLDLAAPQPDNDDMSWGRRVEHVIAEWWHEQHPDWRMRRTGTWASKARPWQIANPDRLVTSPDGAREILEIKWARDSNGWGTPGTADIPVYYRAQVLWYLDVLGLDRARIAVSIGGGDLREYVVEYDPYDVEQLRDQGAEFMRTVAEGERPSIDGHTETYRTVKELHPDIDDRDVGITPELADRYRSALDEAKQAEADKRQVAGEVADIVGDGRRAVCDGETVAIRKAGRNGAAPHLSPAPARKTTQKVSQAA